MNGVWKLKKSFFITICSFLIISTFIGCKKNKTPVYDANSIDLTINESSNDQLNILPNKWHTTNKRVCVVFGYDFNTSEQTSNIISLLEENFGLDSEGGLIYPLIYPTDFKHGTRGYVSDLTAILQDNEKDFSGVVILGAPENTHIALARNQDKWNQEIPYPIVALFPQDDVLGLESTCDIVIDKGHSTQSSGEIEPEESEVQLIPEAPEVLVETIRYISNLTYALPKNSTVQTHVAQMLKGRSFHHYTDPETGLKAINHFVLN